MTNETIYTVKNKGVKSYSISNTNNLIDIFENNVVNNRFFCTFSKLIYFTTGIYFYIPNKSNVNLFQENSLYDIELLSLNGNRDKHFSSSIDFLIRDLTTTINTFGIFALILYYEGNIYSSLCSNDNFCRMNMLKYLSFFFVKILAIIVFVYIKNIMYGLYLRNCLSYDDNLYNNFIVRYEKNKKSYTNFGYFKPNKNFLKVRLKENDGYETLLYTLSTYLIMYLSLFILNNILKVYNIDLYLSNGIFIFYFIILIVKHIWLKFSVNLEKNKVIIYENNGTINNTGLIIGKLQDLLKKNKNIRIIIKFNKKENEFIYNLNFLENQISKYDYLVLKYLELATLKELKIMETDIENNTVNKNIIKFDTSKLNNNIYHNLIENLNSSYDLDETKKKISFNYNELPVFFFKLNKNEVLNFSNTYTNEFILILKLFLNVFDNIFIYIDIFFNFFLAFNSILFIIGYITDTINVLKISSDEDLHNLLFPIRSIEKIDFYKYFELYIFYNLYLVFKNIFENFISYIYLKKNIKVKSFGKKEKYFLNLLDTQIFYICFLFIFIVIALISLKTFILNL